MPAFSSTTCNSNSEDISDPSKMFGLINCEHRSFVSFEFDDYPEYVFNNVEKPSTLSLSHEHQDNLETSKEGVIRIELI